MARRVAWVSVVLAGQLSLAAGFVLLGRIEIFKGAKSIYGGGDRFSDPLEVTSHSIGWPLPWARASYTISNAGRIIRSEWAVTNYALPAAAGLLSFALPLAVGNWLFGTWGRRATSCTPTDRRGRWVWVAVITAVSGLAAAGCEAIAVGSLHVTDLRQLDLWKSLSLSPTQQRGVDDAYLAVAKLMQSWRRSLCVPATDQIYTLITTAGLGFGALLGCLLFRPWQWAGGSSAPDGAAAATYAPGELTGGWGPCGSSASDGAAATTLPSA